MDTSFGFRPERSAIDAIQAIQGHLKQGFRAIYDADLKGYFDTIPHDQLLLALKMRIADRAVLQTLEGRFKLTINREKTKVVNLNDPGSSLDFLGYTFRYDRDLQGRSHRYLNIFPSRKAMAKARDAIRGTGPKRCFMPVVEMISQINQWQTGWTTYFSYSYPRVAFRAIHSYTVEKLVTHLRRRSQRAYRAPAGKSFYAHVHDLGLRRP